MKSLSSMKTNKSMKYLGILLLLAIFVMPPVFAQNTLITCLSNSSAQLNITSRVTINGAEINTTYSETINCPFGCDNSTGGLNDCNTDRTAPNVNNLVAPVILFAVTFFLLYIAINMSKYRALEFLFLGLAMFMMVIQIWYAQRIDTFTFANITGDVLTGAYLGLTIMVTLVILYFIIDLLRNTFGDIAKRKRYDAR